MATALTRPYMMRRRWDYFVKNLIGVEPPYDYLLQSKTDPRGFFLHIN
jgi:hypothetical protein